MEWLMTNWYMIIVFLIVGIVAGMAIKKWLELPTMDQIESVKEWLVYAVTEAEKQLGGKTGQLKLRLVYDMAIEKFKWLSFISFSTFSDWVDEALVVMKDMLKNERIAELIIGEVHDE